MYLREAKTDASWSRTQLGEAWLGFPASGGFSTCNVRFLTESSSKADEEEAVTGHSCCLKSAAECTESRTCLADKRGFPGSPGTEPGMITEEKVLF